MIALLLIPVNVKDKKVMVLEQDKSQAISSPTILYRGSSVRDSDYMVVVDNVKICETSDMLLAFKVLFAVFYIFNLVYPKDREETMTFIQKGLVNIQDNLPCNRKISNFLVAISTAGNTPNETASPD